MPPSLCPSEIYFYFWWFYRRKCLFADVCGSKNGKYFHSKVLQAGKFIKR